MLFQESVTYSVLRFVMPVHELGTDPSRELLDRVLHVHTSHVSLSTASVIAAEIQDKQF